MSSNFFLNENKLSIDILINMTQNNAINLSQPRVSSDLSNKSYVDEQIAVNANANKIIVNSTDQNSENENVQKILEKLANQIQGLLPKTGGTMNAPKK